MDKSVFKVFLSKRSERDWLNTMGNDGYLLTAINDSKYQFKKSDEHKYCYSIEYLDSSPQSDIAEEYFSSRRDEDIIPLVSSGNWVYFAKADGEIELKAEVYKKNSIFYKWRSIYLLFFAVCGAVLCGYQAFAIGYLDRIGYDGNGQIREMIELSDSGGFLVGLLNAFKNVVNFLLKMVNRYFKLWTDVFGESDAVAVISIAAPITVILLVIAAFYIDGYLDCKKSLKQCKLETSSMNGKDGENEKQAV